MQRDWQPATVLRTHRHPFAVKAVVVRGEMWLTVGDTTRHLRVGGKAVLAPGIDDYSDG